MQQTFAIAVYGTLPDSLAAHSALNFSRAVIAQGHSLYRVFFYHGGANIANALAVSGQDEMDLAKQWLEFAAEHQVELAVCVAAAQRRGILSEAEQKRYARPASSALAGFSIVGLGQLLDAAIVSDHLITFPA
ncbi:MAG: sulfurtransferase complex subunit TusD [Pseudomonadales bacterium]